jgi:hypothetical protein
MLDIFDLLQQTHLGEWRKEGRKEGAAERS